MNERHTGSGLFAHATEVAEVKVLRELRAQLKRVKDNLLGWKEYNTEQATLKAFY